MNGSILLVCLTMLSTFVPAGTAGAQSIEEARAAYAEGRFREAADLAKVLDTSEGYILAAKSLAIEGYYIAPDSEKQGLFMQAAQFARTAIRLDGANPEAHLELAHAVGRYALTIGTLKALSDDVASKVRDAILAALQLEPDLAYAHVSLGSWHAGVISDGGFFASQLYGADEEKALAHLERALRLAPQEKSVLFQCALGFLRLDDEDKDGKARNLLEQAINVPPKDAYERILHQRAVRRLSALDGG